MKDNRATCDLAVKLIDELTDLVDHFAQTPTCKANDAIVVAINDLKETMRKLYDSVEFLPVYRLTFIFDGEEDAEPIDLKGWKAVQQELFEAFATEDNTWMDTALDWCQRAQVGDRYDDDDDFKITRVK